MTVLVPTITDNYLLRAYRSLQSNLLPDSVFFLGDLFDGGREWKTDSGRFVDPTLGKKRPADERAQLDRWHRKYGEDFWLQEYSRFGDIFFDRWADGGNKPGPWQRGRKLVSSLPGNHDLGFGAQIQVPVRDRFEAFFGPGNRVDVVGNHTFVSVDAVSLSAASSIYRDKNDLSPIYGPVHRFLDTIEDTKKKAVARELDVWFGREGARLGHRVERLDGADMSQFPLGKRDGGDGQEDADLPTVLLTHVPLYREPGTPCGPMREHWPPTKPPKGQTEPVRPDDRNALSVVAGYQYQNVLSDMDTDRLVGPNGISNVVRAFSGDDHDYCEVVHPETRGGVREITVKSLGMNMGVPTPGFVMASLWNPVDEHGRPLGGGGGGPTIQTRLCLMPNQIHTYMQYIGWAVFTVTLLAVRAFLVPILGLTPFALSPEAQTPSSTASYLPFSAKEKLDPPDLRSSNSSSLGGRLSPAASSSASRASTLTANGRWQSARRPGSSRAPRINLEEGIFIDTGRRRRGGGRAFGQVGREMWTSTWRWAWMAVGFWLWLQRER